MQPGLLGLPVDEVDVGEGLAPAVATPGWGPQHPVEPQRVRQTVQGPGTVVLQREPAMQLGRGVGGDDHAARGCECLEPGRKVGRAAERLAGAVVRGGEQIAHQDLAGGDAGPGGKRGTVGCSQARHGGDGLQRGMHATLGIVVVGHGVAEIGHDAVAQELRHMPAEAQDGVDAGRPVLAHGVEQILGLQARGQPRRIDEVDEGHGQRATLDEAGAGRKPVHQRQCAAEPDPVTDRQAELAQVRVAQGAQLVRLDALVREGGGVLAQAHRVQPCRHHIHALSDRSFKRRATVATCSRSGGSVEPAKHARPWSLSTPPR